MIQILPTLSTAPKIVYYENCKANLYAAVKRQCTSTPGPNISFLTKLNVYIQDVILPEIREILADFHYSQDVWYNHLTSIQQDEMDGIDLTRLGTRYASMFCKSEKQMVEGGEFPKNRAISALCAEHKYVMGPVVYSLEQYFKKFKGYGGGKTWEDMGKQFTQWHDRDLSTIVQSDISGMDRSVVQYLKEMLGHVIYEMVAPYVTHVSYDLWVLHSQPYITKIIAEYFEDKTCSSFGFASLIGKVFSGSSDTTFFNTLLTAIIQRYVIEVLLGLGKDEYDLSAKGDDSVDALPTGFDKNAIRKAFGIAYYNAADTKTLFGHLLTRHGSGMVLKFLSISDHIDDIDYCSTNVFFCEQCHVYRLTRKLDRFIYLTPWSDSIINLPRVQQLAFMENLYISNLRWMDGLPIFTQLNNKLHTSIKCNYSLAGKTKTTRRLNTFDEAWFKTMFNVQYENNKYLLQQQFGKNTAYSMVDQINVINSCCVSSYEKWLEAKLNLSIQDIETIKNDIDLTHDEELVSPMLTFALLNHESYKKSTLE